MRAIRGSGPCASTPSTRRSIAILAAGMLTCLSTWAYGGEHRNSSQPIGSIDRQSAQDVLERHYWVCDYAATTRGVLGVEAEMCATNYEELKKTKFGGDFAAMLAWWQRHKAAAHRALAEGAPTVTARQ